MKATGTLHERGQSLWLDNITRSMLDDGTIQKFIDSYSVTGLTSNPSIFDKAIGSGDYDDAIRAKAGRGLPAEGLFFELAIEDLRRAADLFLGIHERTDRVDGWVLGGHLTAPGQEAARVGFAGQGTLRWMSIRSTEAPRATRTVATISGGNRPCSMTPGIEDSQAASAAGSSAGPW